MEALFDKIKDVVVDFVRWFWNGLNPPDQKEWCAIFYFVAQEDAGLGYPETSLDIKLEATIDVLKNATFDLAKMHVVYRAVWADTGRDPVAAVISSSKLPPETNYFPGCSTVTTPPLDTGKDLNCFLKWAY